MPELPCHLSSTPQCDSYRADCALRSDWVDELAQEKALLATPEVSELARLVII